MDSTALLKILRPNIFRNELEILKSNRNQCLLRFKKINDFQTFKFLNSRAFSESSQKLIFIGMLEIFRPSPTLTDFPFSRCVRQTHFHEFSDKVLLSRESPVGVLMFECSFL